MNHIDYKNNKCYNISIMSERVTTFEQLISNVPDERIETAESYWADRSLSRVVEEMPQLETFRYGNVAVINPDTKDFDETRSLVVLLEYLQGYSPAHYMRAKVMQQYAAPNNRVILVPGAEAMDLSGALSDEEKSELASGDYRPFANMVAEVVEHADHKKKFGTIDITGPSQGALSALGMVGVKNLYCDIGKVVAVDPVSKTDRSIMGLLVDNFTGSGSVGDAVKRSGIPAQQEAMSGLGFTKDIAKFLGKMLFTAEAHLIGRGMTGSAEGLITDALNQPKLDEGAMSIYYIEGSKIFDPLSLSDETRSRVRITQMQASENTDKHMTINNLPFHAAMVNDGILNY